ncbi:MAG: GyrI-like domain-containing protein [Bacteroidota bacterium]
MDNPKLLTIKARKLIGMRIRTSASENNTRYLWQQFKPRVKEIKNTVNANFYAVEVYDKAINLSDFNLDITFEQWAAIEVTDFNKIPEGMEPHTLSGGMYAVFIHKGPAHTFYNTLQYIYGIWLPYSEFESDNREHFEIMGKDYTNPNDPNAEEEVWIPIKKRA